MYISGWPLRKIYPMTIEGTFEASARTFSYLLHVGMESPTAAAIAAATSAITSNTNLSQIQANSPTASLLNFTDPVLLNHWYQLQQLHRLQTEQYSIGLPHYLSQGKIILNTRMYWIIPTLTVIFCTLIDIDF